MKTAFNLRDWPGYLCWPAILLCAFTACQSSAIVSRATAVTTLDAGQIAVFQDSFSYLSIVTDKALPPAKYQATEAYQLLSEYTQNSLTHKGFELILPAPSPQPIRSSSNITAEKLTLLKDQIHPEEVSYFLLLFGVVKVGNAGGWDPMSGAITSNNSYTRIKASLIDASSGDLLWNNEVKFRSIPGAKQKDFAPSIQTLFQSLKSI